MPRYREGTYADESVALENRHVRLEFFKRVTGWGWAELSAPDPATGEWRYLGTLEHLGQADLVGDTALLAQPAGRG